MAVRLEDKKHELLERVVDRLHDRLREPQADLAEAFCRRYYRSVSPDDLIDRDPLDLYGAALAHLRLGEQREAGQAKIRVYNPQVEQHGWQSTHTVVEIVNDDMPFLVDSVGMALNRLGLMIHLTIHPVVPVRRSADGTLEDVLETGRANGGEAALESFMHVEVDRQSDPARLAGIEAELDKVLTDVRLSVTDWRAIGYGCYDLVREKSGDQLKRVEDSALGVLRLHETRSSFSRSFAALPPEVRQRAYDPVPLVITKANARSTVHRPVYLDYIGVRRFDAKGKVVGEHRFLAISLSCAARSRALSSTPTFRARAMPARRSPTSSRPTRATSCSRPRMRSSTTSCRRSCTCRSARRSGCSCAATPSRASSPA
jgi:glutamate dehydrogenase